MLKSKKFQDPILQFTNFYNMTPWRGLFYTNRLAAPAWCPHSALSPGHKHRVSPSTDDCTGQERVRATWWNSQHSLSRALSISLPCWVETSNHYTVYTTRSLLLFKYLMSRNASFDRQGLIIKLHTIEYCIFGLHPSALGLYYNAIFGCVVYYVWVCIMNITFEHYQIIIHVVSARVVIPCR